MNDECSDGPVAPGSMDNEPITFDAFRLAQRRESIDGEAAMAAFPRLASSVLDRDARVHYRVQGQVDEQGHPGAVMSVSARLPLRCERCNDPLLFELERRVPFRFVGDERELNARPIEDDEVEEVVGSTAMDLLAWIEDEVILSLPLVPRHPACAMPARQAVDEPSGDARTSPFAGLAKLKRAGGDGAPDT